MKLKINKSSVKYLTDNHGGMNCVLYEVLSLVHTLPKTQHRVMITDYQAMHIPDRYLAHNHGHKNNACYHVSLHIDNHYESYKMLQSLLLQRWKTKDQIAHEFLAWCILYFGTHVDGYRITYHTIRQHLVGLVRGEY